MYVNVCEQFRRCISMKIKIIYCSGQVLFDGAPPNDTKQKTLFFQDSPSPSLQISSALKGLINQDQDLTSPLHILLVPEIITERPSESKNNSMAANYFTFKYLQNLPKKIKCQVEYYKADLLNEKFLIKNIDEELIRLYEYIHKTIISYPTAILEVEAYFSDETIKNRVYEYYNKHQNLIPEQVTLNLFTQSEDSFRNTQKSSIAGGGLVDLFYKEKIAEYWKAKDLMETNDSEIDFAGFLKFRNQKNIYQLNLSAINNLLIATENNRLLKILRLAALTLQVQNMGNLSNNQLNKFAQSLTLLASKVKNKNNESSENMLCKILEQCVIILKYISDQRYTWKGLFNQNLAVDLLNVAWLPGIINLLNQIATLIENRDARDYYDLLETVHNLNCYYKKYYWIGMGLVCVGLTLILATPALLSIIIPTIIALTSHSLLFTTMTYIAAALILLSGVIEGVFMVRAGNNALKIASNESSLKKELYYDVRTLNLFFPTNKEEEPCNESRSSVKMSNI